MSRHTIPARLPEHVVTVGWDNPMSTYFATVERVDAEDDEERIVLWLGGIDLEYPRAEDMIVPLAPYAELTGAMIVTLREDRVRMLDVGPTWLQRVRAWRVV